LVRVCDAHYSPLFSIVGGVSRGVSGSTLLSASVNLVLVNLFVLVKIVFELSAEAFHEVVP